MTLFNDIRTTLKKRALYNATLRELRSIDQAIARDLDIAPADMPRIAHQAVYG